MPKKPLDITRRNVLATIGAGTLSTGLVTAGSAKSSEFEQFRSTIETAHKIRNNAGRGAYIKYLDGAKFANRSCH